MDAPPAGCDGDTHSTGVQNSCNVPRKATLHLERAFQVHGRVRYILSICIDIY